jgi:hypothetical protein
MHELMVAEPIDPIYNKRLAEEGRRLVELHAILKVKEDRNEDTTAVLNLNDIGDIVTKEHPLAIEEAKHNPRYAKPVSYGRIKLGWR